MLDVKDLNIEFHDHLVPETVVHQVSFHMDAGEIVGLVGESGSRKIHDRTGDRRTFVPP